MSTVISQEDKDSVALRVYVAEQQVRSILKKLEEDIGAAVQVRVLDIGTMSGGISSYIDLIANLKIASCSREETPHQLKVKE